MKFFVILFIMMLFSCNENFLDKKPLGILNPYILDNEDGLDALLIAAYSELDGWTGWNAYYAAAPWHSPGSNWIYGDMTAGDSHKGSDVGDPTPITALEKHEYIFQTNEYIYGKWYATYDAV